MGAVGLEPTKPTKPTKADQGHRGGINLFQVGNMLTWAEYLDFMATVVAGMGCVGAGTVVSVLVSVLAVERWTQRD